MSKSINYLIGLVLLGVVAYNSVYVKKLDDVQAAGNSANEKFDAVGYVGTFWTTKLLPAARQGATDMHSLLALLKTDQEKAFTSYSRALGIGNIRYFLVKGTGTVTAIRENDMAIALPTGETAYLATDYIFGNSVRDASGLIKITDFDNTTDLNNVSAELNELIRKQVIPPLKASAKVGRTLSFTGALELNQAHLHLDGLTIIPIAVN